MMALSVEAIVAIVTLLVTSPPAFFVLWKLYRCYFRPNIRTAYELEVLPAVNYPPPHDHLIHYQFTERRVETRVVRSHSQHYATPAFAMGDDV